MREQRSKRRFERILAGSMPVRRRRRVVVLCYHSIHPSKRFASATPELFEQHVAWLRDHCEIVPYRSIPNVPAVPDGRRPIVAITFDDGYEDNHTFAMPILLAYGVHATVFVTTGLVDRDPSVINRFERLWSASAEEVRGLSWSQVLEMRDAGFEIGAHTHGHPKLSTIERSRVVEEIGSSRTSIEEHLGQPVRLFAYPFGKPREHLSDETIRIVSRFSFDSAATVSYRGVRASDNPLSIPRFPVTRDSLNVLSGKVWGRLDTIGVWQERSPLWIARLIASDPATDDD